MNHLFRVPDFSSPVDSAHPTLPAGYSPIKQYVRGGKFRIISRARNFTPYLQFQYQPTVKPLVSTSSIKARSDMTEPKTYKEPPSRQDVEHAHAIPVVVRPSSQGSENNQDDGRDQQRVRPRPMVREPAEGELADDRAGKRDVADVLLGVRGGVDVAVLESKYSRDGTDNLQRPSQEGPA